MSLLQLITILNSRNFTSWFLSLSKISLSNPVRLVWTIQIRQSLSLLYLSIWVSPYEAAHMTHGLTTEHHFWSYFVKQSCSLGPISLSCSAVNYSIYYVRANQLHRGYGNERPQVLCALKSAANISSQFVWTKLIICLSVTSRKHLLQCLSVIIPSWQSIQSILRGNEHGKWNQSIHPP